MTFSSFSFELRGGGHFCVGPNQRNACSAQYEAYLKARPQVPYVQWQGETGGKAPEYGFYAGGRLGPTSSGPGVLVESPEELDEEAAKYAAAKATDDARRERAKIDEEPARLRRLKYEADERARLKRHEDARGVKTRRARTPSA